MSRLSSEQSDSSGMSSMLRIDGNGRRSRMLSGRSVRHGRQLSELDRLRSGDSSCSSPSVSDWRDCSRQTHWHSSSNNKQPLPPQSHLRRRCVHRYPPLAHRPPRSPLLLSESAFPPLLALLCRRRPHQQRRVLLTLSEDDLVDAHEEVAEVVFGRL